MAVDSSQIAEGFGSEYREMALEADSGSMRRLIALKALQMERDLVERLAALLGVSYQDALAALDALACSQENSERKEDPASELE
jgi:hypothetical protein